MVAHPDGVERVLRSHRANYVKGSAYDGARLLLGDGLVTSEGERWRRHRDLANPAFRPARLARYLPAMTDCTRELLDGWTGRDVLTLNAGVEMGGLTLAIATRTLFGLAARDLSDQAMGDFGIALEEIGRRGPSHLQIPLWLPTPGNLRLRGALRRLDAIVYDIIARFRAGQARRPEATLLGAYIESRDPETGQGMDDRQLRDEVMTLYLAGHETTASLLAWALYTLARSPDVAERVAAELDATPLDEPPTLEQLKGLGYLSRVIDEVLRLYPPAWTVARNALADDRFQGYRIPAGSIVLVSPYFTHRLEAFWPEPLRFDPDRFLPDIARARHPFAYLPFSLGPRICIGMQFALYEARLVLAMILKRYRVQPADAQPVGCRAAGTLRPDRDILVELKAR
jgi:cytochrome P450